MDVLYLSPEFPPNYFHFIRQLHAEGLRVWAVGEADFYSLPADLRACIRWYARAELANFRRVEPAVAEILEIKHAQGFEGPFDVIESHNEQWLRLEAFLNDRLGVPGIGIREIEPFKKKSVMKRLFQELGLPVARGAVVAGLEEARRLAEAIGYPLILKPNEGVGAAGVRRVDRPEQLEAAAGRLDEDHLLEEFIDAPIVTYDGLTDWDGAVVFESTLNYGDGLIDYPQGKDTFFYADRTVPEPLAAAGRAIVARFGIRRKFFHIEFFRTGAHLVPIEVNCRPPGGAILDMMNYAIDGDLYRAWARMLRRRPLELPAEKKYFVGYVGRKPTPHALGHEELVARLGPRLVETGDNPRLFWDIMGAVRYIFRAPEASAVLAMADLARQPGGAP
jgi:hypothetical protein